MGNLTMQDIVAIAFAGGIKLGGGSWSKALIYGAGARVAMSYLGFPTAQCAPPAAQGLMQSFSSLFQTLTGRQPVQQAPTTVAATVSTPTGSETVIDASYTQAQGVPNPAGGN